ncbi:MAG TPA: DUF6600 domain-containing protein [Pseudolabrys sp.]|nr:DUF6600 domain-containing protein [Pseudolabrys sp.]
MIKRTSFRSLGLGLLGGLAILAAAITAPIVLGAFTPAQAQVQVSVEFREALTPHGEWRRHGRWGEVWVPSRRPSGWRPYEYGHWVYTDEWGWFWVSDDTEQDWGWVTYHYGRWMHDDSGWFWIPGDEWAPAWVDWRYTDDYVGWAPLPPADVVIEAEPAYWVFVPPRYITAPRLRTYIAPRERVVIVLRNSRLVNRTVIVSGGARIAVNPGISPVFIASVTRTPIATYRVNPRVVASTRGVSGAVVVREEDLRRGRQGGRTTTRTVTRTTVVQKTTTVIKPEAKRPEAPQALGKDEKGRLGNRPPKAAQTAAPVNQQQLGGQQQERREQKPAETKPSETKPAETKPATGNQQQERRGQQPAQTKPAPAPAKPAQTAPAKPAPAKPAPAAQGKPATPAPQRSEQPRQGAAPARTNEPAQVRPARPTAPQTPPPAARQNAAPKPPAEPKASPAARPVQPTPPAATRPAQPQQQRPAQPQRPAPAQKPAEKPEEKR